ncbi:MAG TPA: hypothetical protein VHS31_12310 [Tepidisphaeraceae bacterium]|jgi:hypothetical protein|nr:hypothetical protein [Tepidisphaeraceae bacterium]
MNQPQRRNPIAFALWANAALLAGILYVLVGRSNSSTMLSMALGADDAAKIPLAPQPIAGGAGLFLMPAQFAVNQWGCYIMDVDRKTICAYQFFPNDHQLRLMAARNFTYDLMLKNLNTGTNPGEMMPEEVHKLVEKEQQDQRVRGATDTAPPAETPAKQE